MTTPLPHLTGDPYVTDGGLETTLIFDDGLDLPDFAAFTLVDDEEGTAALRRYYEAYVRVAADRGTGAVLDTATWRASADWGARLGFDARRLDDANRRLVELVADVGARRGSAATPVLVSGCVGPRGDGYVADSTMTREGAADYHFAQVASLAAAGVDLVTALTLSTVAEASGIADAAASAGIPVVLSFTVETDGRLPDGTALADAVRAVDEQTGSRAEYLMVNCAHPTHFRDALEPGADWTSRIGGVRSNASTLSHAELDEAETLDRGDVDELAGLHGDLRDNLPGLHAVGGCCGTDHTHVDAIARAVLAR